MSKFLISSNRTMRSSELHVNLSYKRIFIQISIITKNRRYSTEYFCTVVHLLFESLFNVFSILLIGNRREVSKRRNFRSKNSHIH